MSQIAVGVPCTEYPRTIFQSGPVLINIRWNLTCFGPIRSVDLLGWGSMSSGCSQKLLKQVGVQLLVLGVSFSSHSHLAHISLPSHFPLTFDM
jgi:hypothetical protein